MELLSNCNDELIPLHALNESIVKYLFATNKNVFISYKVTDKEYLLSIKHIASIRILNNVSSSQQEGQTDTLSECVLFIELSDNMELYEYYQWHKTWICTKCKAVNPIDPIHDDMKTNEDISSRLRCISCRDMIEELNPCLFYRESEYYMKDGHDPLSTSIKFTSQRRFYRKLTAFNTHS